ncbi:MAG: DNA helicase RecQ [Spirochaetales bacterium]|nr:DNA helicase RecQ [Spirochaetales bacterium]
MYKLLKRHFGYDKFRPNQEEIIKAILSGKDVFASLPTGGGKSLCYQLPALRFDGLTVVISPLIALMKDQVDEVQTKEIPAAFLNSSLESDETAEIYSRLYRNQIKLLYLSPERLAVEGYMERLKELNVSFFAVDEAHCLSEWGHDFRPDYLVLSRIRENFPQVPIAAFTATATHKVQEDIVRLLNLKDPFQVRASFDRKELSYRVRPKKDVLTQIEGYVKDHQNDSGIVYRTSRKDVEKTASHLRERGLKALPYHAGLTKEKRNEYQDLFNRDEVNVMVATTAFGMGINKTNIRYVLHGDLPKSMEAYYQETGRAGRDGMDSECVLFFSSGDRAKQKYFIDQLDNPEEQQKSLDNLNYLVRFAQVNQCRRKQILAFFGEEGADHCGNCDVCNDTREKVRATVDAQKLLSAVIRTGESFGIAHIIDIVRGADTEKIRSRNHQNIKTYGVGKDKSKVWWRGIMDELLGQEMIYQDSNRYNVIKLTDRGRRVLFGEEEFYISDTTASRQDEKSRKSSAQIDLGPVDEELLQRLKEVRTELAREGQVPPYIIFSDKTLRDMAARKPETGSEMLDVSGVGEKKRELYGSRFLSVIGDFIARGEGAT